MFGELLLAPVVVYMQVFTLYVSGQFAFARHTIAFEADVIGNLDAIVPTLSGSPMTLYCTYTVPYNVPLPSPTIRTRCLHRWPVLVTMGLFRLILISRRLIRLVV